MEREEPRGIQANTGLYFIGNKCPEGIQRTSIGDLLNYFRDKVICQVDTETTGYFDHRNRILTLQIGTTERQFVIELQSLSEKEKKEISDKILNNPKIIKILHNAKFDIKFIWFEGMEICSVYDTMLAECILNAGRETEEGFYSLGSLAKRYCNAILNKEVRGQIHREGLSRRVVEYAGNDVKYLELIREQQLQKCIELKLASENCQDIYTVVGLENNAVVVFASIEYNGMLLDTRKWEEVREITRIEQDKILRELDNLVFEDNRLREFWTIYQDLFTEAEKRVTINWSSPDQKLKLLNKIGKFESTKQQELEKKKRDYPIVDKLIKFNKIQKLISSFADPLPKFINKQTNRIHTEFWQILSTGRVSSSEPNLQQIPARTELGGKMRECFVAPEGYKIVGGDFSGCELRIIAEYSEDPVWLDAFKSGEDLHSKLCSLTFGIPISEVKNPSHFKPDLKYRDIQKTINFGL